MIHESMVPTSNITAYIILVVVELLEFGHAAQHNEHAALPKQQAS